ncbi:MAG TPA: ABC transporter ATP-binding protein [Terriglobales bacterium]|nr:ABC transporter ATP-binding protein [Terriglobales bacterium]
MKSLPQERSEIVGERASTPVQDAVRPLLQVKNIAKSFSKRPVLNDISLEVAAGEFLTVLGESGSGKTTLLRIIAGFEQPTSGQVLMNGERLDPSPPHKRRVNTVFQSYALFPHLSVEENVGYGPRVAGVPATEVKSRVDEALAKVRMQPFAKYKPAKISGGQQQRVALARALVNRPQLLLLDEPLSALDANLRRQMQIELKALQREVGITFIFVTHDQEEAMVMSDRIALLRAGELEQVAAPDEIYSRPATSYAAQFIGHTNLLKTEVQNGIARSGSISWPANAPEGSTLISLRPECIRPVSSDPSAVKFRARAIDHSFHGASELVRVETADGQVLSIRSNQRGLLRGEIDLEFSPDDAVPVRDSGQ